MHGKRLCLRLLVVSLLATAAFTLRASDFLTPHLLLTNSSLNVRFDLTPDLGGYYILDESTNLLQFTPRTMLYGGGSNAWSFTVSLADKPQTFWRARRISASTPLDIDGDGIDDLYELSHGINPLDSSDAGLQSGFSDLGLLNRY